MKKTYMVLFSAFIGLLSSCSSDVESSLNYIKKFELNIKPVEINVVHGSEQSQVYIWTETSNYNLLKNEVPNVEVSSGAILLFDSSKDWTAKDFKYTVKAENGDTRNYTVQIDTATIPKKYSFETWSNTEGYYIPSDSNSRWVSGNAGISIALGILGIDNNNPENYPTRKTTEGYEGNGVLMETIRGGRVVIKDVPLFSGNFILGNFDRNKAMNDELAATEIGKIYFGKPKSIKGYYKYKEGPGNFERNGVPEPNTRDSCSMNVRFYQSDSPSGKDTTITVKDMDTSSLIIATASKLDCSETEGDGFHPFELVLEYKSEHLQNHRYKLGMTFAASKYGDSYSGKIGSTLIIDEIEIVDHEQE